MQIQDSKNILIISVSCNFVSPVILNKRCRPPLHFNIRCWAFDVHREFTAKAQTVAAHALLGREGAEGRKVFGVGNEMPIDASIFFDTLTS
jgi:hypothetical protein